jgi:hypothetical protein
VILLLQSTTFPQAPAPQLPLRPLQIHSTKRTCKKDEYEKSPGYSSSPGHATDKMMIVSKNYAGQRITGGFERRLFSDPTLGPIQKRQKLKMEGGKYFEFLGVRMIPGKWILIPVGDEFEFWSWEV